MRDRVDLLRALCGLRSHRGSMSALWRSPHPGRRGSAWGVKGAPAGGQGWLGVFSFNGNKIITTSGGEMLVSNDEPLIERARFLATKGS